MLRFHLTGEDLHRLRLADRLDPMWEIAFTLHLLQSREPDLVFAAWRQEVCAALESAELTRAVRELARLYPRSEPFPDFLVPPGTAGDLDIGIDRVLATPAATIAAELAQLAAGTRPLPSWATALAAGDAAGLRRFGRLLRAYHTIAVAPYASRAATAFEADRAQRAEAVLSGGVRGLLGSFPPQLMSWHDDILSTPCPVDADIRADGRSIVMVPSFFCGPNLFAVVQPELPIMLTYPVARPADWLTRGRDALDTSAVPLSRLVGSARAAALNAIGSGVNTSRLAAIIGVSMATASRHASVLREAGLVSSERRGQSMVHVRTRLGTALLNGRVPRI
ncbi:ArsR/SmtB family transcription factor [Embleya sp. NPDC059237]|uniref:ArsR/SmtB family transcription factor n=1 Tax=Embleya sp. NPDC059237 TaxID=3346784 RepID=UPI0036A07D95